MAMPRLPMAAHGGVPITHGSFEIAYACMPFDQFLTEDFHRRSSSMLGVAITLPTTTFSTVPTHRHAQISPYMRTCKSPPSPFGKGGLCNQDCRLQAESPTYAGKLGRELVLLLLGIDLIGVDELVQQLVEGGHVLVDDAVSILGLGRGTNHLLIGVKVMTRSARAE